MEELLLIMAELSEEAMAELLGDVAIHTRVQVLSADEVPVSFMEYRCVSIFIDRRVNGRPTIPFHGWHVCWAGIQGESAVVDCYNPHGYEPWYRFVELGDPNFYSLFKETMKEAFRAAEHAAAPNEEMKIVYDRLDIK